MTFWIRDGKLVGRMTRADGTAMSDKAQLEHFSAVKVETTATGTTMQWHMGSANWASLLYAVTFVRTLTAPYHIMYFNMGWIEETVPDATRLALRVEQLICKSDVHFSQRIYTQEEPTEMADLPKPLREALAKADADDDQNASSVMQVGDKSLVASIWGVSQVSFPCLSGNSYDRVVSQSYFEAVRRNRPVYDHVLAVMVKPDGEHHWMGYQRVIIPELGNGLKRSVKVVSALAPVNISLL
jgi:hypothetical protein